MANEYFLKLFKKISKNIFSPEHFSLDDDLRSKLIKNNQKINDTKEIFLYTFSPFPI